MSTPKNDFDSLSRREREVMYLVHEHGEVSAEKVQEEIDTAISYSGARRYLAILEEKGFLTMKKRGNRYYYSPLESSTEVGLTLLKRAFGAFFKGSPTLGIATFVQREGGKLNEDEVALLEKIVRETAEDDE